MPAVSAKLAWPTLQQAAPGFASLVALSFVD
jgi:hypothetical protein